MCSGPRAVGNTVYAIRPITVYRRTRDRCVENDATRLIDMFSRPDDDARSHYTSATRVAE